jgi:hypothetical protein
VLKHITSPAQENNRLLAVFSTGGVFWTKFEHFLTKIQKTNLDSAGQTIFLGEWNCPASAFFPPAGGVWGGMRAGF